MTEARYLWATQPSNEALNILVDTARYHLRRQSVLGWLWLRANGHKSHAEILVPETQDLVALQVELQRDPESWARIYFEDLNEILSERASKMRKLIGQIEDATWPYNEETQRALESAKTRQ